MSKHVITAALIEALVRETGAPDAVAAVRIKAEQLLSDFQAAFGVSTIPVDIEAIASFRGINTTDDVPIHSADAELVPVGNDRVAMRINRDRPETRQRFSIAHEIGHTFFPEYHTKPWCRSDGRFRQRNNPDDQLEFLCDTAAAELLLPRPWFPEDAASVTTGTGLLSLAQKYGVSRDATLRRFAETHPRVVAAAFFSWKLKPTEKAVLGESAQGRLFPIDPTLVRQLRRLRLDYAVPSTPCAAAGHYLPRDKSIENDNPLYAAAAMGLPCEGECHLDLGPVAGRYHVIAVPVWTDEQELGPNGENAVGAILEPLGRRGGKRPLVTSGNLLS